MIRPKIWKSDELKQFVSENSNLVSVKPILDEPGLSILKYKKKVFFNRLWTPELCEFRGTVVDKDFNLVMRPFTKIFNYDECGANIDPNEPCIAVRKINGFMGQATVYNGRVLVATTGTMDSEYAEIAKRWILPYQDQLIKLGEGVTYIFEICDKEDPHIIVEKPGLYLLGVRINTWNTPQTFLNQRSLDILAMTLSQGRTFNNNIMMRPGWHSDKFQIIKEQVKLAKHEGYVVYGLKSGDCLKFKTPYYLVSKFIARMSIQKLDDLLNNPDQFKKKLDEEFYNLIDYLVKNHKTVLLLDEQVRLKYIREFFEGQI